MFFSVEAEPAHSVPVCCVMALGQTQRRRLLGPQNGLGLAHLSFGEIWKIRPNAPPKC